MIELTDEQRKALDAPTEQPPVVVDPRTKQRIPPDSSGDVRESPRLLETVRPGMGQPG